MTCPGGCAACSAPSPTMMRSFCIENRASLQEILRRTQARRAQNKCKIARVRLPCATKRAILAQKIARVCGVCATPSPPMMRNFCTETRACFRQILRRTHARRAQKQMQTCERSLKKTSDINAGMRRKLRGCPYGEHDELRRSKSAHYGAQNQRKSLFYAIKNKVLHRF